MSKKTPTQRFLAGLSPARKLRKKDELAAPGSSSRFPETRSGSEEGEVTPRHIIKNMLAVQGTAQPISRKKKRVSDAAMRPPASQAKNRRKVARPRSSTAFMDLDEVIRKFTPRTNIQGFLEQAPEETPAARNMKSTSATDSHSTTQNVSSIALNEVGVSMLEGRSSGGAVGNVSASGGRFQRKTRQLNIPLPQETSKSVLQTPEQRRSFAGTDATVTFHQSITGTANFNGNTSTFHPRNEEDTLNASNLKASPQAGSAKRATPAPEPERSVHIDTNVFTTILGDSNDVSFGHQNEDETDLEMLKKTPVQTSQKETEQIQGGPKARTPMSVTSDRTLRSQRRIESERSPSSVHSRSGGSKSNTPTRSPLRGSNRKDSSSVTIAGYLTRHSSPAITADAGENENWEGDSPLQETSHRKTFVTGSSPPVQSLSARRSVRTPNTSTLGTPSKPSTPRSASGRTSALKASGLNASVSSALDGRSSSAGLRSRKSDDNSQALLHKESGGVKMSKSSVAARLSDRFHSQESTNFATRSDNEESHDMEAEENSTKGAELIESFENQEEEISDLAQRPTGQSEDDSSEEEDEGYSPLKTPRLPLRQSTPNTTLLASVGRKMTASDAKEKLQPAKRRALGSRRANNPTGLPTSVIKATFSHFCQLRVSKEAIEEVEKMSEQYWMNMAEDLESFAIHAHRKIIDESDVELLMKRQGFITDRCSLNTLIAKYLPLELRQQLIPIARSGNKLEPKC